MNLFSSALYFFFITKQSLDNPFYEQKVIVGDYFVYLSRCTDYVYKERGNCKCLIIGDACCLAEDKEAIDWLLEHADTIENLSEAENFLGGKYVIFAQIKEDYYLLGDATGSVPVFYADINGSFVGASNDYQIATDYQLEPDKGLLKMREQANAAHTMPFDKTIWKAVRRLLPNHYVNVSNRSIHRIVNAPQEQSTLSAEEAAAKTIPSIKRLVHYYAERYTLACPLTSGRDSRVVLAFLGSSPDMPVYTMKHAEFSDATQDVTVPLEIAKHIGLNYQQVEDILSPQQLVDAADSFFGKGNYNSRTLMLANTINHYFGKYAVINGDIIGQVGKCSLHRDIPLKYATPSYFRCKLHNYSAAAKKELQAWIDDVYASNETVNLFDLFSIESRMGVWAADENEVYNAIGQNYLNIFNSRSIIYTWTRVDRGIRKNAEIHKAIISMLNPKLLAIPFERTGRLDGLAKYNGMTYLMASYVKHIVESLKFKLCHN